MDITPLELMIANITISILLTIYGLVRWYRAWREAKRIHKRHLANIEAIKEEQKKQMID